MSTRTALLLDVGNTRLKWGLLESGHLTKTGTVTHAKLKETGFSVLTARLPRRVDCVLASNVAGQSFATRLAGKRVTVRQDGRPGVSGTAWGIDADGALLLRTSGQVRRVLSGSVELQDSAEARA